MERVRRSMLLQVAARELRWLLTDKVARFTAIYVPLIALIITTLIFSQAVIHNLGVMVVDADRSRTSTVFAETIDASPAINVTMRGDDLSHAVQAIKSGEVIAAVYVPPDFERELSAGLQPQVVFLYNNQFLTPGGAAASGLRASLTAAINATNDFVLTQFFMGTKAPLVTAGPLQVREIVLGNASTNYAQLLLRSGAPVILHIIIAILAAYSAGREFSRYGLRQWLDASGANPAVALAGKMLPLFVIGMIWLLSLTAVQSIGFGLPVRGSLLMLVVANALLLIAYQSIGTIVSLLTRDLATGFSLIGIIASPAFGFCGVGMPIFAMGLFAQTWSAILPLRWYIQVLFDQATRGVAVAHSMGAFLVLAGYALLYTLIAWLYLKYLANKQELVAIPDEEAPSHYCKPTLASVIKTEGRRILLDRAMMGMFLTGALFYSVFYPQPYLNQLTRDVPVAVVDLDNTTVSQRLVLAIDASEALNVAFRASTLEDAQSALEQGDVYGIIQIPADTERKVLRGTPVSLPTYVDGTYFGIFGRVISGVISAAFAEDADRLAFGGREDSAVAKFGMARIIPAVQLAQPLFNPTGGYASYVVPAAFVLIIQQLLLMASGGLRPLVPVFGTTPVTPLDRLRAAIITTTGQTLTQVALMMPATIFLLSVMPHVYGVSMLGRFSDFFPILLPFLCATSLMGQAIGFWFKRSYTVVVLFIALGLPLFFSAGVAWPSTSIPFLVRQLSLVFPSSSAIDGFIRINQMGARLHDVQGEWRILLALTFTYFILAVLPRAIYANRNLQERTA